MFCNCQLIRKTPVFLFTISSLFSFFLLKVGMLMKEERYAELVNKSKTNSEAMLKLIITMTPLIRKYSKKLFFMEYEDAEQEMVLALIKAVKKISKCETDGQCINYLQNAIKYHFSNLCKKNMQRKKCEEVCCENNVISYTERYTDVDFIYDLTKLVHRSIINWTF